MDMEEYNRKVIEEFHANGGKVGGQFEGMPLLLLTTTGARSGKRHTTPLMYVPDGDRMIVFASMLGAPANPAWYHNLLAHPEVIIEVGSETFEGTATVTNDGERSQLWTRASDLYPFLKDHQAKTSRRIPVIALQKVKT